MFLLFTVRQHKLFLSQWFPNWGYYAMLRGVTRNENHSVVLYYNWLLFLRGKILRVIRHNRYLDLGNGSNKFGNHCPKQTFYNITSTTKEHLQYTLPWLTQHAC